MGTVYEHLFVCFCLFVLFLFFWGVGGGQEGKSQVK